MGCQAANEAGAQNHVTLETGENIARNDRTQSKDQSRERQRAQRTEQRARSKERRAKSEEKLIADRAEIGERIASLEE